MPDYLQTGAGCVVKQINRLQELNMMAQLPADTWVKLPEVSFLCALLFLFSAHYYLPNRVVA